MLGKIRQDILMKYDWGFFKNFLFILSSLSAKLNYVFKIYLSFSVYIFNALNQVLICSIYSII